MAFKRSRKNDVKTFINLRGFAPFSSSSNSEHFGLRPQQITIGAI